MPADMQTPSRCLLVLGMHRSGTSAMTRCLNLVGMDVGPNLLTPDEGNAKGYWEHADVVRINDALLSAFGMLWWSLDPLPDGWLKSEAAAQARVEIETFVRRDFSGVPLWGLKDPRMCRLAPLWIDVIRSMGFVIESVFVNRPPLEVARSMVRGHGLPEEACVLGWMQHLAEAELATRNLRRAIVSYEQLLADPLAVLDRIGVDLALTWPVRPALRRDALSAFIDKGMRTQGNVPDEAANIPALARRMELAARTVAEQPAGAHDWTPLSALCANALEDLDLLAYRRPALLPDELERARSAAGFHAERMFVALYHAAEGEPFSEDRVITRDLPLGRTQCELPLQTGAGLKYRLDPISHPGYCIIHSLLVLDAQHQVIWDWQLAPDQVDLVGISEVESLSQPGCRLHRVDHDPQMHFAWPEGTISEGSVLRLDIERFETVHMGRELAALQTAMTHAAEEHRSKVVSCEGVIERLQQEHHAQTLAWQGEIKRLQQEHREESRAMDARLEDERARSSALIQHLADTRQSLVGLVAVAEPMRHTQLRQHQALQVLLGRSLLARLHRRFRSIEFHLSPVQHLELVDAAQGRWRVTGDDPIFTCTSGRLPLGAGWYMVSLELQQHAGLPVEARLYPDYGVDAPQDMQGLPLPFIGAGRSFHRGVVRVPRTLYGLRFDPADSPCDISIGALSIRRVSKMHSAWTMLRSIVVASHMPGKPSGWRKIARQLRTHGIRGFRHWLHAAYTAPVADTDSYDKWLRNYDAITPQDIEVAHDQVTGWENRPLVSILVPVYNSPKKWLRRCIEGVRAQAYPHWQLCLVNDASTMPHVAGILDEYAAADQRVKVVHRPVNGHISATSNSALALAEGEFIALLDHDDELHPLALFEVVKSLQAHPSRKLIYTDEDKIDEHGHRYDPYMKPEWNYDLLLSQNYLSHFGVYQRQLVLDVGGFRTGYEGSQDWDLALRCIERLKPGEIGHIARVLYHWRAIPGSTAIGVGEKSYARSAGVRAVAEHLQRMGVDASVEEAEAKQGHLHIRYALPTPQPKVSLLIPTRDGLHLLKRCVESILELTHYDNYEIVIVDNQSCEPETLAYFAQVVVDPRVRVLAYNQPFNYSALNNYAVQQTSGELVALVNNDIEVISPHWLQEMAAHAMRPGIGAVGAMLYYPNNRIQHAGVVLGVGGVAGHAYCGCPRGYNGQMGRARIAQNLSAVTAACLVIRRSVFDEAGGLNESLRIAFNDIDFCLRVRRLGYRNLWTPFAELYHHESATRGYEDSPEKQARFAGEVERMLSIWGDELATDPAYSPNLTLTGSPFELAFPPRTIS